MDSAKVTISFEGSPEAVLSAMATLLRLSGAPGESGPLGDAGAGASALAAWDQDEMRRLWRAITPGARAVLAKLATQPDGYENAQLCAELGLDGRTIGGRLSSVGLALRRLGYIRPGQPASKPRPWQFDGAVYRMERDVARLVTELTRTEG